MTDPSGRVIALPRWRDRALLRQNLDLVPAAEASFPKQASGFFLQEGELYHLSVTPVYVQSGLINVLVAGERWMR